ncbi:MAG: WD40/YVTN/BNR-like repeat-containing protein [Woeseiaceae bacterium]
MSTRPFSSILGAVAGILIACFLATPAYTQETVDPDLFSALKWREIGPWRGGRVTAVTGVPGNPRLYYMGATGGGVWKTVNAGISWENISDDYFNVGTIGAIAVAESDINVIYAGTGEAPIRGVTTSHGDGIYKSTDAGATWKHIGLTHAGQIARVVVHPKDPDLVYVAVQGQIWGPSERGIYRSSDGGENWTQVLEVNDETGATDLSMDPSNPRILYAAMWEHGRKPWFVKSGGTAGGMFKSTDAGDTWEKLEGGLPELIGKIGVDVSTSMPNRIYAIVEAELDKGGLYRSDDFGETWELLNNDRILWSRAWYYIHIKADPVDENTVYVLNAPFMKSIDGGKTFEKKSTPHGDHHDHWINPQDNKNMINANDGGATVTFDGGESWSSIRNQPTAQFYRVITDNLTPYRIYGGQQDNSTVAIASETFDRGIGLDDFYPVGGGESAHIAFDENNPRLVYATTINGTLTEYDHATKLERPIKPYPEYVFGQQSKDLKYRTNWNAPVATSPHDPSIIYYGTQMVLRSDDRGVTWTEISPDLTKNEVDKQGLNGGPLTPENVGAEFYGTLFYIVESPHEAGTIWVGSDDGLLHISRDNGDTWEDVTPGNLRGAMVNAIEISPHDPGTVYLAVAGYKLNDFTPYVFKVSDYGDDWERIDGGLPEDNFVRVVREDPDRAGLLYAGTEGGMYMSFDDGDNWQSLDLNLPPVPITDLTIRHDDLVASTQGRGFWVLDDLSVVRQSEESLARKPLHLFTPPDTAMIRGGRSAGANEGSNPPRGVTLSYYINDEQAGPLTIEILDMSGNVIRTYSSEEGDFERCIISNMDQRIPFEVEYPAAEPGLNQWTWDMRRDGLNCIEDVKLFAGFGGASVIPGAYQALVTIGDSQSTASITLLPDPRTDASSEDYRFLATRLSEVSELLNELLDSLAAARKARSQVQSLLADFPNVEGLQLAGESAIDRITAWENEVTQTQYGTYEDEDSMPPMLDVHVRHVLDVVDEAGAPVAAGSLLRLDDLKAQWAERKAELEEIAASDIATVNEWASTNGAPHATPPVND